MAAPTDVSVEATSITSTRVYWAHGGAVDLYRSLNGSSYSFVATIESLLLYDDTGLEPGTKYWYKLTDDNASTFSSVVTTWTMECLVGQASLNKFSLPRFAGPEQQDDSLNDMAVRIETALGERLLNPGQCVGCPDDGRLVFDCGRGCDDWVVIADEDINSITLMNCDERPVNIEFIVPPSTTRRICGWPQGFGFSGDECRKTPFITGAAGGSISGSGGGGSGSSKPSSSGRNRYNPGPGKGSGAGGGGGSACTCVPKNGGLTIKACNSNNSLKCTTTKSLKVIACGGKEPYTWSKTGSVVLDKTTGVSNTVTPPTNSGSGVAGVAFIKTIVGVGCGHTSGTTHGAGITEASYGCNDAQILCPSSVGGGDTTVAGFFDGACSCSTHSGHPVSGGGSTTTVSCGNNGGSGGECTTVDAVGAVNDKRTAPMIAAGCGPCALSQGETVSVTDAAGVTFTIVLEA